MSYHGRRIRYYTVSQKNIPDIFDYNLKTNHQILMIFGTNIHYNLKTNHQILMIFGTNIPDTTCHQMTSMMWTIL